MTVRLLYCSLLEGLWYQPVLILVIVVFIGIVNLFVSHDSEPVGV